MNSKPFSPSTISSPSNVGKSYLNMIKKSSSDSQGSGGSSTPPPTSPTISAPTPPPPPPQSSSLLKHDSSSHHININPSLTSSNSSSSSSSSNKTTTVTGAVAARAVHFDGSRPSASGSQDDSERTHSDSDNSPELTYTSLNSNQSKKSISVGMIINDQNDVPNPLISCVLLQHKKSLFNPWVKRFLVLARKETGGLMLLIFTVQAQTQTISSNATSNATAASNTSSSAKSVLNSPSQYKLKRVIELGTGCEARMVSGKEVSNRSFVFEILTAKKQYRFQASSQQECDSWLKTLGTEFKAEIERHLQDQKYKLLVSGEHFTIHKANLSSSSSSSLLLSSAMSPSAIKPSNYFVYLDDQRTTLYLESDPTNKISTPSMNDSEKKEIYKIPFSSVESVIAGNDTDILRTVRAFHFNCFALKLKERNQDFGMTVDFEATKQTTRDEWVSALQAMLSIDASTLSVIRQKAQLMPQITLARNALTHKASAANVMYPSGPSTPTPSSANAAQSIVSPPTPTPASPTVETKSATRTRPSIVGSFMRFASHAKDQSASKDSASAASSYSSNPATANSSINHNVSFSSSTETTEESEGGEEGPASKVRIQASRLRPSGPSGFAESGPVAGGLGEIFKSKVKVAKNFEYGRCISHALRVAFGATNDPTAVKTTTGKLLNSTSSSSQGAALKLRELVKADFEQRDMYKLELIPTEELSSPSSPPLVEEKKGFIPTKKASISRTKTIKYEMHDLAPEVFKQLRAVFGIFDEDYVKSMSALSGDGIVGDGKSGMLFFFTQDRKYILKTVKQNELDLFLGKGMIDGYAKHMKEYPDSLICRFLGLYRFRMGPKPESAKWINLVAMVNSFDTKIVLHEKYDLKGSTRNRWCVPKFGSVLKDLNFTSQLFVDEADKKEIITQIQKDVKFMESFNVMDYSLLLGIHKPPDATAARALGLLKIAEDDSEKAGIASITAARNSLHSYAHGLRRTRWQRDFGGVEGRGQNNRPEVYIMCIIDILQAYDMGKKAEHMIKTLSGGEGEQKEISSVDPKTYAARFITYCEKIIVGVPGLNKSIMESREQLRKEKSENIEQIEIETKQAIEKEQEGKNITGTGAGYTEVLEDGTEIEIRDDGTQIQRYIDGSVLTIYPDGRRYQVNDDGSTIETKLNGTLVQKHADGTLIVQDGVTSIQTTVLPDKTKIEAFPSGLKIQYDPDGLVITFQLDGSTKQTHPDGTVLITLLDGTKIQQDKSGTRTTALPDGTLKQDASGAGNGDIDRDGKRRR